MEDLLLIKSRAVHSSTISIGEFANFQMQFEKLPAWVHNNLDRAISSYVWAKHDGAKGVHLINWDTLTKPKRLGG